MADQFFDQAGTGSNNANVGGQYLTSSRDSSLAATYGDAVHVTGADTIGGETSFNSYEQASYGSALDADASGLDTSASSGFNVTSLGGNTLSGTSLAAGAAGLSSASGFEMGSSQQQRVQVNLENPQNLFQDPNPQILRRPAQGGLLTYTQNVKVRFLQPPPVPPPGPLIIKEVRPPQPPPPPPLRIRQQAPPPAQPPPLVLRERPPVPPTVVATQTVIRRLPGLPLPPRSVIIERLPPLPPKPRDIIIERWLPYAAPAKRKTIVQRAPPAKPYPKPRNIIIQYEPIRVRVIRQFQRLSVIQENPQLYVQRYGVTLLDSQSLVQQARAAGVIEDISPPRNDATIAASSSSLNAEFNSANSGVEGASDVNFAAGASVSSFEPANYGINQQGNASFSSFGSVQGVGLSGQSLSANESNSVVSQQSAGASASATDAHLDVTDSAAAAFQAADLNKDGSLDPQEFRQFLSTQLRQQQ